MLRLSETSYAASTAPALAMAPTLPSPAPAPSPRLPSPLPAPAPARIRFSHRCLHASTPKDKYAAFHYNLLAALPQPARPSQCFVLDAWCCRERPEYSGFEESFKGGGVGGTIFYVCGRGRYAGLVVIEVEKNRVDMVMKAGETAKCGSIEEGCSTATRGRSRWRREMSGVAGHLEDGSGEVWGAGFAS